MDQEIIQTTADQIIQESLINSMGYGEYRLLVSNLVVEGKSTGPIQNLELSNYTLLNNQRMKRLDKTMKIDVETELKIKAVNKKITWLVLTESWCGDAAQTVPIMNRMASINRNISLKLVLRDENLKLMEQFLSDGAMAIPKLIAIDDSSGRLIGRWGSRPSIAKNRVGEVKSKYGKLSLEFKQDLQLWYNLDKGQNTVSDLLSLLSLE